MGKHKIKEAMDVANVLLINPSRWGRGITAIWIPAHAASLKAAGHNVKLFDCTFYKDWMVNETAYNTANQQYKPTDYDSFVKLKTTDVYQDLQNEIDTFKPDLIFWSGLSSHIHGEGEYVNIQYGYDLIEKMKTNAVKVSGGLQPMADPELMFHRFPLMNYFIRGESDLLIADIASNLATPARIHELRGLVWKDGDRTAVNPRQEIISDMDQIPPYDYSVFEDQIFWRPYNGQVVRAVDYELSRGCIYTCGYCVETVIQRYYGFDEASPRTGALVGAPKYLRNKSAKRIYQEWEMLKNNFGIQLLRCQDTNFLTIKRAVLTELAAMLKEKPLGLKLYIETRADGIGDSEIELLKSLGVDGVGMGVELSNEAFRKDSLNRHASQEKILNAFRKLKEAGIRRTAFNIIGLPNETEDMILDTVRFNQELAPDNITVAFYSPYIGTAQHRKATELQYFENYEYDVDGQLRSVSRHGHISKEALDFYKRNFVQLVRGGLGKLNELKARELADVTA